jgi:hypothetical protein
MNIFGIQYASTHFTVNFGTNESILSANVVLGWAKMIASTSFDIAGRSSSYLSTGTKGGATTTTPPTTRPTYFDVDMKAVKPVDDLDPTLSFASLS